MVYQKPIRVLHVFSRMDRGGAETMIMNLYRHINRKNVQFDFVVHTQDVCAYDKEILELGGKIYSAPRFSPLHIISYIRWWRDFLAASQYAVIHGHIRSIAVFYLWIAKKKGIPTIIHSHSTSSGTGIRAIAKNILQFPVRYIADFLFACSLNSGIWLFGRSACQKSNFYILKNAIDTSIFMFSKEKREHVRAELNLESNLVIGHIGRFTKAKNHKFLLQVFKVIQECVPTARLLLVGDGELKKSILEEIKALNLPDYVILLGTRMDVADLLQAIDIMVFPSLWEGFGLTLLEAQATGIMCFASDCIPSEVKITNLINYLPLDKTAVYWSDEILKNIEYDRSSPSDLIKSSGYDIYDTAKWLEDFYRRIMRETI